VKLLPKAVTALIMPDEEARLLGGLVELKLKQLSGYKAGTQTAGSSSRRYGDDSPV
jgi:hypothetical protein